MGWRLCFSGWQFLENRFSWCQMCVITRIIAQLRPHYERELNTLTEFLHVVDKNRLQPRTVYARYEQRTLKLSYQAAQTHQPLSLDLIAGPDAPALELNFAIPPAAKHDDIVAYFFEGFNFSCLYNVGANPSPPFS